MLIQFGFEEPPIRHSLDRVELLCFACIGLSFLSLSRGIGGWVLTFALIISEAELSNQLPHTRVDLHLVLVLDAVLTQEIELDVVLWALHALHILHLQKNHPNLPLASRKNSAMHQTPLS